MNNSFARTLLFITVFFNAVVPVVKAQQTNHVSLTAGLWKGTIQISVDRVFNIAIENIDNNGDAKYFFHSIDQNSYDFPIRKITVQNDSLSLYISSLNAAVVLKINNAVAEGYFSQGNVRFPVKLEKTSQPLLKPKRPQEPVYPLSYNEEDVLIKNNAENVTLAGTLTYPKDKQPHPAVLLIPGSGPSDRNQSIFGHKNFLVLSDMLTRNGFVVLRMDDRGVGESTGDFMNTSIKDFAADAAACVQYLKNRKEVSHGQVGVIGHSLGADIAAYLAANNSDVNFVVLMAGSAEKLNKTIIRQTEKIYKEKGASAEAVALNTDILKAVFNVVEHTPNDSIAMQKITAAFAPLNQRLAAIGSEQQALIETAYPLNTESFAHMLTRGMRFDLFYNPAPTFLKMKQPVLVLHGDKDVQVFSDNSQVIIKQLKKQNHRLLTQEKIYGSVNHMFQKCNTCTIDEYGQIEETISPVIAEDLIKWLKKVVQQ